MSEQTGKRRKGFAAMQPETQRSIASKGGKTAHRLGTAHEWSSEEARDAGRRGGLASGMARKARQEVETEPVPPGYGA